MDIEQEGKEPTIWHLCGETKARELMKNEIKSQ